jgi:hypothetical protein
LAVLAGLLLFVFVMAVLADVTSVNIDSPTEANPVYVKPGFTFTVQYDAAGNENVNVKIYLDGTQVYTENVGLPVSNRQVNPTVPGGFADGKYDLKVEAIGTSTKSITETAAVIVDTVAPTATIDAIGACVGTLASITGNAWDASSGVDKVYAKIQNSDGKWWDGTWQVTETWNQATGTTDWSYGAPTLEDAKTYTVTAKSKDVAGTETISVTQPSATFTVDQGAPTVAITPTLPAWENSPFALAGTASDTGCGGLSNVQVQVYNVTGARYWNGAQWVATPEWNNATGTANWTYNMPALTTGRTYQVKAKATDGVGNSAESAASTFQYDDVEPTEAITAPENGKYYNALAQFTGTASDAHSGVAKVELTQQRQSDNNYWDDVSSGWIVTRTLLPATGTTSWSYPAPTLANGETYTLTAKATDNAGNDPGTLVLFYFDTLTPTATITDTGSPVGCDFAQIEGTAADGFAGVDNVYVQIDAGAWVTATTWTDPNWTLDVSSFPFVDGVSYDVRAKAVDNAGNETAAGAQPTRTFTYDACPTVAFTAPEPGAILSDLDDFTGTAADAGSGSVQDVQVMIQRGLTSDYWDGSAWVGGQTWLGAMDSSAGGDWSMWISDTIGVGWTDEQYILHAKAEDDFSQWSDVVTRTLTIDATAPDVTIDPIANNTQPTQFSGVVTETLAGVDWVKIAIENESGQYWDGDSWEDPPATWHEATVGSPWSYNASGVAFQGGETYTVYAKGRDKAGNESAPVQDDFVYGASADIPLGAGWNLMSVPLIPNDEAIANVMAGLNVDWVTTFVWEGGVLTEKKWDPPIQQLTTMTTGQGYWVKMFSAGTLTNAGLFQPNPPNVPKSYNVSSGWNMIGYHATTAARLGTPPTVEDYLGTALIGHVQAMYYYQGGVYQAVTAPTTEDMDVGYGYWLALSQGGTIYP